MTSSIAVGAAASHGRGVTLYTSLTCIYSPDYNHYTAVSRVFMHAHTGSLFNCLRMPDYVTTYSR
jgi:hypothetical protein